MEIVIASSNEGKIREINKYMNPLGITAKSVCEYLGYDVDVEETEETYIGNAKLKAKKIYEICKVPVIADDSGMEIEAMPGEFGVYTARYMGKETSIDEKIKKIYEETKGKSQNVKYVCSMYYYAGEECEIISEAEIAGTISRLPKGENGFAYDKIFYCPTHNKTMAEMSVEEKNEISHRAKALEKLVVKLKKIMEM